MAIVPEEQQSLLERYDIPIRKRDIFLSQLKDQQTRRSSLYHLCHPRTHITWLALCLIMCLLTFMSLCLVSNWVHVPNTILPSKFHSPVTHTVSFSHPVESRLWEHVYGDWLIPLLLVCVLLLHMFTVLGPVQTLCFLLITLGGNVGMNQVLSVEFLENEWSSILLNGGGKVSGKDQVTVNMVTSALTQSLIMYLSHCMADMIIYGRVSKHRLSEVEGRRLWRPQLVFLPVFSALISLFIDDFLFGAMLHQSNLVSFSFMNSGGSDSGASNGHMFFGMKLVYIVASGACRIGIFILYLSVEMLADWCLALVNEKLNADPDDRRHVCSNLVYSFFRPACAIYPILDLEWVDTLVAIGRFLFVYVFLWLVWLCFGVMFSTVVDPFVLRIIGSMVFGGVGIASVAAVLRFGKSTPGEEPVRIIN